MQLQSLYLPFELTCPTKTIKKTFKKCFILFIFAMSSCRHKTRKSTLVTSSYLQAWLFQFVKYQEALVQARKKNDTAFFQACCF